MESIDIKTIEKLVFNVQKPARYIGGELNQVVKDNPFIRMAICYPDLYEIGMSNNGIRILYHIANKIDDVLCGRVFAVDRDFEDIIRKTGVPLFTLETYTPLCKLDIIGFNMSHELLYTNILQVIDLGQIPVRSRDRSEGHPIILAGGSAASNPAPVSEFIDAFFMGDGEEGIIDIISAVRTAKMNSLSRIQTLELIQQIQGIYAPLVYTKSKSKKIIKRVYRDSEFKDPAEPIIPNIRITQEKLVIELTRGCRNLCKFCHAGYYELPYRQNNPDSVRDRILKTIESAHYNELTLSSLSINDYRPLVKLLNHILPALIEKGISISLPSLKVDKDTLPVIENISDLRKTSLTFAVESACEDIRLRANKNLETDDLLSIAEHVFRSGWKLIKLYFMLGLPGCEEHDEAGSIIELLKKIERIGGRKRDINVTLSPFVPKPHTPFQRERQMSSEYFFDSISRIKRAVPRSVSIKAHNVYASVLEGVLARGDESLCEVIYLSYMDGCRLDSWTEHFKYDIWKKNLDLAAPGWSAFLDRKIESDTMPWDFVSSGYERLISIQKNKSIPLRKLKPVLRDETLDATAIEDALEKFKKKYLVKTRVRLTFSKTGNARFIPHLDFVEIVKRAARSGGVPVSFSQGFNKRERMSFGFPLPIGIESVCELCDVDLYDISPPDMIKSRIGDNLPAGIKIIGVKTPPGTKSLMSEISAMEYSISVFDDMLFSNLERSLEGKITMRKKTKAGEKKIGFDDAIIDFKNAVDDSANNTVELKIFAGTENSIRIDDMALSLAEAGYDDFYKFKITKMRQYARDENGLREIT